MSVITRGSRGLGRQCAAAVVITIAIGSTLPVRASGHATEPPQGQPAEIWIIPGRRYYFPVQPPHIARYGSRHHDYPATDIFVPVGSTVVAVTAGVVDEVSRVDRWDPRTDDGAARGGLWVTMIGDDGVRYHASHLSSVESGIDAGIRVYAGQIIGRSGNTGNAIRTPPHVHFGISRPTFAGDWINRRGQVQPYRYLRAWARGVDVTPAVAAPVARSSPTRSRAVGAIRPSPSAVYSV